MLNFISFMVGLFLATAAVLQTATNSRAVCFLLCHWSTSRLNCLGLLHFGLIPKQPGVIKAQGTRGHRFPCSVIRGKYKMDTCASGTGSSLLILSQDAALWPSVVMVPSRRTGLRQVLS